MTLLYYDPIFLQHDTGMHPEQAPRLSRTMSHLSAIGLDQRCQRPTWEPVSTQRLTRVHQISYVNSLAEFAQQGGGRIEIDTMVSPRSYEVARRAAGAVCDAVERVVRGDDTQAVCLVRPPGHHALEDGAMGFCLFNSIAIGTRLATAELSLDRVLIVDWDVHHGNGTQDAFWDDEQVGFFSIHRYPFYPGTGSADETGGGKGRGNTLNLPIRFGTTRRDYLTIFTNKLEEFAAKIQPQLILISAGFDSHRLDPIGSLGLEVEDYSVLTNVVLDIAAAYTGGKLISVLEGGYNLDVLPKCVETHLEQLLQRQKQQ